MGSRIKKDRRAAGIKVVKSKTPTPIYARQDFIYGTDRQREQMLRDRGMMPDQQPAAPTTEEN